MEMPPIGIVIDFVCVPMRFCGNQHFQHTVLIDAVTVDVLNRVHEISHDFKHAMFCETCHSIRVPLIFLCVSFCGDFEIEI